MRVQEFTKPLVTQLITESAIAEAEGKNTHLEHLEDNIFNKGYDGAKEAINYLYSLHEMLDGSTNSPVSMTTKWDGAPAIVAGRDPETGKFFVDTKGVFARKPKNALAFEARIRLIVARGLAPNSISCEISPKLY